MSTWVAIYLNFKKGRRRVNDTGFGSASVDENVLFIL
jgi:hypothetical protein